MKSLLGYFASRDLPEDANKIQGILPSEANSIRENFPPVLEESPKMLNRNELESDGLLLVNHREEPVRCIVYSFAFLKAHGHSEKRTA